MLILITLRKSVECKSEKANKIQPDQEVKGIKETIKKKRETEDRNRRKDEKEENIK